MPPLRRRYWASSNSEPPVHSPVEKQKRPRAGEARASLLGHQGQPSETSLGMPYRTDGRLPDGHCLIRAGSSGVPAKWRGLLPIRRTRGGLVVVLSLFGSLGGQSLDELIKLSRPQIASQKDSKARAVGKRSREPLTLSHRLVRMVVLENVKLVSTWDVASQSHLVIWPQVHRGSVGLNEVLEDACEVPRLWPEHSPTTFNRQIVCSWLIVKLHQRRPARSR